MNKYPELSILLTPAEKASASAIKDYIDQQRQDFTQRSDSGQAYLHELVLGVDRDHNIVSLDEPVNNDVDILRRPRRYIVRIALLDGARAKAGNRIPLLSPLREQHIPRYSEAYCDPTHVYLGQKALDLHTKFGELHVPLKTMDEPVLFRGNPVAPLDEVL